MPQYRLGVDIGGTKIQVGLVNKQNKLVRTKQFPLNSKNKKTVLDSLNRAVSQLLLPEVWAIGIGITGQTTFSTGISIGSPNLPADWRRVPLKKIIEQRFRVPVTINNDANAIGLAESIVGAGRKYNIVLTLTLGTGVGSGLTINKKIYSGARNHVEFGHIFIGERSTACSCGQFGHFESYVSGPSINKLFMAAGGKNKDSYTIISEARRGNKLARQTLKKISHFLSIGLWNALYCYDPDIIILGGGLVREESLIKPAIVEVKRLLPASLAPIRIVRSRLGYRAGVIGAALLTTQP